MSNDFDSDETEDTPELKPFFHGEDDNPLLMSEEDIEFDDDDVFNEDDDEFDYE